MEKFDAKCDGKHSCEEEPIGVDRYAVLAHTFHFLPLMTYSIADTYDKHLFHIMIQNDLIYLAMTTQDFERRIAFSFLDKIRLALKLEI